MSERQLSFLSTSTSEDTGDNRQSRMCMNKDGCIDTLDRNVERGKGA